jgi:hypothetical protein
MQGALAGTAVGLALGTGAPARAQQPRPAPPPQKLSRQEVEYQDTPKNLQMCSICTLFVAPRSCKLVEGEVSPDGWCKIFDMID